MTPEDLEQANADADADLAQLEGVDPAEFQALVESGTDRFANLECDFGDGLVEELRPFTDG